MKFTLESIANWSAKKPWPVIGIWILVIAAALFAISRYLPASLTNSQEFSTPPESARVEQLIHDNFPNQSNSELLIIHSDSLSVSTAEFRDFTSKQISQLKNLGGETVAQVQSYFETPSPSLVSGDQKTLLVPVTLAGSSEEQTSHIPAIRQAVFSHGDNRFETFLTGPISVNYDFETSSEEDLQKAELLGLPVALVILLFVFGAIVASIVPLIIAGISILIAIGLVAVIGQMQPFSIFAINMITMMGLAVGIDYSLLVISRFREERGHNIAKNRAITIASQTALRAVLFSGLTVILALLGIFIVPMNIFRSLGGGAVLVVAVTLFASATLLPAILSLLGDRINKGSIRSLSPAINKKSGFQALINRILARPVSSLLLAVAILLLIAAPMADLKIGNSGPESLPANLPAKQGFDALNTHFTTGLLSPIQIAITTPLPSPQTNEAVTKLQAKLQSDPQFGPSIKQVNNNKTVTVLTIQTKIDPADDKANEAIERLRQTIIPSIFEDVSAQALVGGQAAANTDFVTLVKDSTPTVLIFVLGLSFLLLLLVFRSIVVPLKAIVMNLLSVGAAYGAIVLFNQKGWGTSVFGFEKVNVVDAWIPLFLFSVLFGLSMDYHVFLLSRVREFFNRGLSNSAAVAKGVQSTASLITGAALIMVAVFGAFAAGNLVMFQQLGFGLAVAILLDATIVRTLLVPASMKLLDKWNWYLPKKLAWLPNIRIESTTNSK